MRTALALAVFPTTALLMLSACGQKGPLYLPEPASNVVVRPTPSAQPAPPPEDATKEKEKKPESATTRSD